MQTNKENSKTPETTETKGTQVAPKRNPADINAGNEQKNTGNTNNDPTKQKPRPATGTRPIRQTAAEKCNARVTFLGGPVRRPSRNTTALPP